MPKLNVAFDRTELQHLQRVLNKGGLAVHQQPMQALFKGGTRLILEQARERAPRRSGETLAGIRDAYGSTGIKPWGVGRVTNLTKQGAILNNGGRTKGGKWTKTGSPSIHRAGPRKGKRTLGWFSGVLRLASVRRGIDSLAREAAAEMGRRWQRG